MSGWRIQINLVNRAPNVANPKMSLFGIKLYGSIVIVRIKPYPPNFSKIAAKIMDPAIGASTCALGNHRCVEYIGNFTKNPMIISSHIVDDDILCAICIEIVIFIDFR